MGGGQGRGASCTMIKIVPIFAFYIPPSPFPPFPTTLIKRDTLLWDSGFAMIQSRNPIPENCRVERDFQVQNPRENDANLMS